MDSKKLFKRLSYLVLSIFIVNFAANTFYWYSSIWYFDMIMHFTGGLWVGLAALYLFAPQKVSFRSVFFVLLAVLVVGIGWEIFELIFGNYIAQNPFNILDTLSDIFFDLSGGTAGILYYYKRIMNDKGIAVQ